MSFVGNAMPGADFPAIENTSVVPTNAGAAPQGATSTGAAAPTQGAGFLAQSAASTNQPQTVTNPNAAPAAASADNKSNLNDFFASMWKPPVQSNAQPGVPPANPAAAPAAAPVATVEQQQQYVMQQLGLTPVSLNDTQRQELQQGNYGSLERIVNDAQQRAFTAAIKASGALVKDAVSKALQASGQQTKTFVEGNAARQQMQQALPFTANPAFAPVAETVMKKALDTGVDVPTAIGMTRAYFAAMSQATQQQQQPANASFNGSYSGSPQPSTDQIDWMSVLGGGA